MTLKSRKNTGEDQKDGENSRVSMFIEVIEY